jgi:hypothetical protein
MRSKKGPSPNLSQRCICDFLAHGAHFVKDDASGLAHGIHRQTRPVIWAGNLRCQTIVHESSNQPCLHCRHRVSNHRRVHLHPNAESVRSSSPVLLDRCECLNRIRYLWTTLPLFTPDGLLNAGLWKLPMFFPPTRPDISPAQISKLNCKPDSCAPSPVFVIITLVCYQSGTVEFLLPSQVSFRPPG